MIKTISKRSIILISVIILLVAAAATVMLVPQTRNYVIGLFSEDESKKEEKARDKAHEDALESSSQGGDELGKAVFDGDRDKVARIHDQKIESAKGDDRVDAYLGKAEALDGMDDKQGALAALLAAEKLSPDSLAVVSFAASLYENTGNYKLAAQYYRKAADIVGKQGSTSSGLATPAEYIQRAEELEVK